MLHANIVICCSFASFLQPYGLIDRLLRHGCRSVTMDAWSADQLKKMQAGGNGALNDFFKQYGVDKYTDIRDKYNNRVAEVRLTLPSARLCL
jgi:hypothetical protein